MSLVKPMLNLTLSITFNGAALTYHFYIINKYELKYGKLLISPIKQMKALDEKKAQYEKFKDTPGHDPKNGVFQGYFKDKNKSRIIQG